MKTPGITGRFGSAADLRSGHLHLIKHDISSAKQLDRRVGERGKNIRNKELENDDREPQS
jgi:hypothetical protein